MIKNKITHTFPTTIISCRGCRFCNCSDSWFYTMYRQTSELPIHNFETITISTSLNNPHSHIGSHVTHHLWDLSLLRKNIFNAGIDRYELWNLIMLKESTPSPLPPLSSVVEEVVPILVLEVESTRNIDTRQSWQFTNSKRILWNQLNNSF